MYVPVQTHVAQLRNKCVQLFSYPCNTSFLCFNKQEKAPLKRSTSALNDVDLSAYCGHTKDDCKCKADCEIRRGEEEARPVVS